MPTVRGRSVDLGALEGITRDVLESFGFYLTTGPILMQDGRAGFARMSSSGLVQFLTVRWNPDRRLFYPFDNAIGAEDEPYELEPADLAFIAGTPTGTFLF